MNALEKCSSLQMSHRKAMRKGTNIAFWHFPQKILQKTSCSWMKGKFHKSSDTQHLNSTILADCAGRKLGLHEASFAEGLGAGPLFQLWELQDASRWWAPGKSCPPAQLTAPASRDALSSTFPSPDKPCHVWYLPGSAQSCLSFSAQPASGRWWKVGGKESCARWEWLLCGLIVIGKGECFKLKE